MVNPILFKKQGRNTIIIFLVFIMSLNVVVMTRDIFNLFVFLEVASIATVGLIFMDKNDKALSAGFKYILATAVISGLFLLGIIFSYYYTGSLNLKDLIAFDFSTVKEASIAVYLIIIALTLELKPFPANGWALDVYEAVNPGLSAMISSASATASLFVLYKIIPLGDEKLASIVALIGILTFVFSNLFAIKQDKTNRLLGYSSVGQIGLLVFVIGISKMLGADFEKIFFALLVTHYLAKAGLFWLSGIVKEKNIKDWSNIRKNPILVVLFGSFVFMLLGFPPFPSFFGKWELIMQLGNSGHFFWITAILIGSFLEGIYLFKWFGYVLKLENESLPKLDIKLNKIIPPVVFAVIAYVLGYYTGTFVDAAKGINYIPLLFIVFISFIDFLPAWIKNTISLLGVILYTIQIYPDFEGDLLRQIFAGIFLGGAIVALFVGYYYKGRRRGFHSVTLMMFVGLIMLIKASNLFEIFYAWEIMTVGSYFLLIRGKKSMPHGYSYMMFSLGGSYAMLFGFALAFASSGSLALSSLSGITIYPTLAYSLMLIGFMTKTASFGVHSWLPGAHGEAVVDIHFMASAVLLKAGAFGIILVLMGMGSEALYAKNILYVLGWIGAISALIGNIQASFQESAKRLLAWSSIGQLGYIVFGLALMTHLGWMGSIFYTAAHFLYKGVLFLILGGIALKLGTPYMYKMGGLIRRMPFSFVAVLIAIITLAGVPPLAGFTGKWLLYGAFVSKGWYFQGVVVAFSGVIAFLYLFRLIYSIFLGPIKDEHRHVKELPISILIPVYALLGVIMVISARPDLVLKPLGNYLKTYFPTDTITWTGTMASTRFGHFDGHLIMIIVVIVFATLLGWLLFVSRKSQKVGMFNIVYSAERPESPQTAHFAHNMFSHYRKSLGFLAFPFVPMFWSSIADFIYSISDFFRKLYTGNGQSYIMHILGFILFFYFISNGGIF